MSWICTVRINKYLSYRCVERVSHRYHLPYKTYCRWTGEMLSRHNSTLFLLTCLRGGKGCEEGRKYHGEVEQAGGRILRTRGSAW